MRLVRRGFLAGACALAAAGAGAGWLVSTSRRRVPKANLAVDPKGILDLPAGYQYRILERSGDPMTDGHIAPASPDGMACFEGPDSTFVLMRNHELDVGRSPEPLVAYDPDRSGGVSRLVLDRTTLARKSSNWVLTGTSRNCAGGASPWGWLSCEETTEDGHGYVFVCRIDAQRAEEAVRVPSLGRFRHEAAAVDPSTKVIYLTEDERDGCLYRHIPGRTPLVGRLEAMKIVGAAGKRLDRDLTIGARLEVTWVPVADPEGDPVSPREQAMRQGAAIVNRGEGIWYHGGSVFFTSTEGGLAEVGQVFRLEPTATGGTLWLIAQGDGDGGLVNPDNITVSPAGEVFVVEDNDGPNHIHLLEENGNVTPFARNRLDGGRSELCGVCFSPGGAAMFVNIQEAGLTLAITGPFRQG